jgi:glycogen synthase
MAESDKLTGPSKGFNFEQFLWDEQQVDLLRKNLAEFRPRNVLYCSFESRFAASGGLAAVTKNILPWLSRIEGVERAALLTPYYPHIIDRSLLDETDLSFEVEFCGKIIPARLLLYQDQRTDPPIAEYFLEAPGFFESGRNVRDPYHYDEDPHRSGKALALNAQFFCRAVPSALTALGLTRDTLLHLQEWQTALACFSVKKQILAGRLESCACAVTMHNPYDHEFPWFEIEKTIGLVCAARLRGRAGQPHGITAYQIGLSLSDVPITTVSVNFARELTQDSLQTSQFTPHLQRIFAEHKIVGVNNGAFADFSERFPLRHEHTTEEIAKIKTESRARLLQILDEYRPPERFGELTYQGGSITELPDDIPIYAASGRLDPTQKGFDILLRAIAEFAADEIKVVLTPIAIRESDLGFFRWIAERCAGNLTVFPIRLQRGYVELQTGATFGIMPSIYEPFGAAMEYMLNGTPVIARATGGLADQVEDMVNGFLYREGNTHYNDDNIRDFIARAGDVGSRDGNMWVAEMTMRLKETIRRTTEFYQLSRGPYYEMIKRGFYRVREISWEKAAERYGEIYNMAGR